MQSRRNHLLLVKLRSAQAANDLRYAAKSLRYSTDSVARCVYINRDLTREEAKLAYEERQKRRSRRPQNGRVPDTVTLNTVSSATVDHRDSANSDSDQVGFSLKYVGNIQCYVINAQRIVNKLDELHHILYNIVCDMVLITETWLSSYITESILDPRGEFNIVCKDRQNCRGGGVCDSNHTLMHSGYVPGTRSGWF